MSEELPPPWEDRYSDEIAAVDDVKVDSHLRATITLSDQQSSAVKSFKHWFHSPTVPKWNNDGSANFFLFNGYAGTGKTTVLPFFIDESGLNFDQVLFVAPTGKASKVMAKKLFAQGVRADCSTIHRAIYRPQAMKAFMIERDLEEVQTALGIARREGDGDMIKELARREKQLRKDLDRAYDEAAPKFQLNSEANLTEKYSLIVVDECSMVGEEMADDILSFGVPVLAIGDPFQLQPVGDPPGFCNRGADAALTEVHRQAADNPIIWASMQVRAGKPLQLGSHGDGQLRVLTRKQDDVTFDIERDVQILVGTHQKRWQITREIRKLSGLHLEGPAAGEIMVCNKNSRKYASLVNGTMLMVEDDVGKLKSGDVTFEMKVRDEDGNIYECSCIQAVIEEHYLGKNESTAPKPVVFKAKQQRGNDQIDFGYALTVHKAQGSQWNDVVLHDEGAVFRDQSDNWRYTGITRAAETLTVIVP